MQGEAFDYPKVFFEEEVHEIRRVHPDQIQIEKAVGVIKKSKQPIIISGGGVLYSEAEEQISNYAKKHNIPVTQTVMGIGVNGRGIEICAKTAMRNDPKIIVKMFAVLSSIEMIPA